MSLTIVIATFNRKNVLKKLLKCLERQSDRGFEVVVVVDGSTDGTQEWLERYRKESPFGLRWFDTGLTDTYGLAIARNKGIKEAHGKAVVILDDDSFPTRHFVEEHKKSVTPKVLTGGWIQINDPYYPGTERMEEYLDVYGDCTPKDFTPFTKQKHKNVIENNICMYKQDWLDAGMFDESVNEYGIIGYEFFDRLIERGYKYQFNPRARIDHKEEYKRSYGRWKKTSHTIPIWLKKIVHPIKVRMKKYAPKLYFKIKKIVGRSV